MRLGLRLSETDLRSAQKRKKAHSPSWPLGPLGLDLVLPYVLARRPCARKIWGCLFSVPLDRLRQMCAIWLELLNRTLSNCLLSEGRHCAMSEGHRRWAILCNDVKRSTKNMKVLMKWQRVLNFFFFFGFSRRTYQPLRDYKAVTGLTHSS